MTKKKLKRKKDHETGFRKGLLKRIQYNFKITILCIFAIIIGVILLAFYGILSL